MAKYKSSLKKIAKTLKKYKFSAALGTISISLIFLYTIHMHDNRLSVDQKTYGPLLGLIADVESKGNYNAYFGNAANSSINFTTMTIGQVLDWQTKFINQGNPSSAVGRYQIVNTTLSGLVYQHAINRDELYDQKMQDKLAVKLLERRGSIAYVNDELTRDQFAANLAKEWASLPKVVGDNPNDSYYQADGLNKSLVNVRDVLNAIEPIKSAR